MIFALNFQKDGKIRSAKARQIVLIVLIFQSLGTLFSERCNQKNMKILFDNITKRYENSGSILPALDQFSWRAEGGKIYGLIGPNGAGKTTLIRMLLNLFGPDSGQIVVDSAPLTSQSQSFLKRLGYLPEERGLYRRESPNGMLCYLGRLKGMDKKEAASRAKIMLEQFGLAEWKNRRIDTLSKGMAQKLQIIACLLHKPELLVLDEPFYGLDPINICLFRNMISKERSRGVLIILCTHMMSEAEALCDEVCLLNRGTTRNTGPSR